MLIPATGQLSANDGNFRVKARAQFFKWIIDVANCGETRSCPAGVPLGDAICKPHFRCLIVVVAGGEP